MNVKQEIKFSWENAEQTEIPVDFYGRLIDHANNHIFEMRKERYTSGELFYTIEDMDYTGWWSVTSKIEPN